MNANFKVTFTLLALLSTASATVAAPGENSGLRQDVNELQSQVAALLAAANAPLRDRVAGKTYAVRSTGHGISGDPDEDFVPDFYERSLQKPFRDFSVSSGTFELREDGTFSQRSNLVVIGAETALEDGEIVALYRSPSFPLDADGFWSVDDATNEIVLDNGQRLQASPSGEVLTMVANDQRLSDGAVDIPEYFLTFIADAVYIQLPD